MRHHLLLLAIFLGVTWNAVAADPQRDPIRSAAAKSLVLLEKSAAQYTENRQCFSCHHQALPVLVLTTARARGFPVQDKEIERQVKHTAAFLAKNRANYEKGKGQGGQADTAGYGLLTLEAGGWQADATTAAVIEYFLLRDKEQDFWRVTSQRPPSEASSFTTTYLALRALKKFGPAEKQKLIEERIDKARGWLLKAAAQDTEDRVSRLLALQVTGADAKDLQSALLALLQSQRADGGWSQLDKLDSDAYATGSVLTALHQAGGLPVREKAYQRGVKFLLQTQKPDGSWHIRSRSKPFQLYFESGFPHGKDQFISIAGSSWATMALVLACAP